MREKGSGEYEETRGQEDKRRKQVGGPEWEEDQLGGVV
jgi:hypothetical protein